jgi:hypothetical protein
MQDRSFFCPLDFPDPQQHGDFALDDLRQAGLIGRVTVPDERPQRAYCFEEHSFTLG